jgi:hypothetical protein
MDEFQTTSGLVGPGRLVFTSSALDEKGSPLFEVSNTITFEEKEGKTKLDIHVTVSKIQPGAAPYLAGMNEEWKQTLNGLEKFVIKK